MILSVFLSHFLFRSIFLYIFLKKSSSNLLWTKLKSLPAFKGFSNWYFIPLFSFHIVLLYFYEHFSREKVSASSFFFVFEFDRSKKKNTVFLFAHFSVFTKHKVDYSNTKQKPTNNSILLLYSDIFVYFWGKSILNISNPKKKSPIRCVLLLKFDTKDP